jgi:hypothetical protein
MLSADELVSKYESYTDEELYAIYANISGYSADAQKAFDVVLQKRGGIEKIVSSLNEKQHIQNEIRRIEKETEESVKNGFDAVFIKRSISSTILSAAEVDSIVNRKFELVDAEIADKKITSKTITGSIAGGLVASLVNGAAWGLILIYTNTYSPILFIGSLFTCYAIVKLFTRQSGKNAVVLITSIIAAFLAFAVGSLVYMAIGYRG